MGKSNDPAWPILTAPPRFSLAGTPLGSPNPPVWIAAAGLVVVGMTELPVEKVFVATTLGAGALGSIGSLLSIFISGAFTSSSGCLCSGAGTISLATAGASTTGCGFATRRGFTGWGSCSTGGA